MHTMTLRLDEDVAQPAIEAATAIGVSLNEFVSRAIVQSLVLRREEILAGVRDDMARYSEVLDYLGTH
jgi:uncharacterized protein (DUF1778 family)